MEYGLRWQEFDKQERLVTKERLFKTEKQLQAFLKKLEQKDNFYSGYAMSKPH